MLNLKTDIVKNGFSIQTARRTDKKGKTIRVLPIENAGVCIHRMNLINILHKNINPKNIFLEQKLHSWEKDRDHYNLYFANGNTIKTKCVIACDGINSQVRTKLFPQIQKRYSGQTIWRGISKVNLDLVFKSSYIEFWGDNLRFATIPISEESYYWYAVKESKEGEVDNQLSIKQDLSILFGDFHPSIKRVIENSLNIQRNDMYDILPHTFPWHSGQIVFLGDAIHATTPNLAQGGCQAIEDAYTLAKIISKVGIAREAFELYLELRKAKVFQIVKQSWKYGKFSHPKNILLEYFTKFVLQVLPDSYFLKQHQSIVDLCYLKKI
ncbi:FAD dependent oxidoreductase [Leptospira ryugenii]|uniref:FAD dependent oxidoreductase n=1 Tax=Leptospira ryugenii TaxID=1917863 RepID=A0A2P2DXW7_9LEPT|nr:FAD-dependent monooxygenase [Leptospira ryugenii]GBF49478.1 FAD dependent oxidoreductase [Leptospira ryugenii]